MARIEEKPKWWPLCPDPEDIFTMERSVATAARDFGKKFGFDPVIILGLKGDGDHLIASFGTTRALCDLAEQIAERLENLLDEITE